MISKRVGEMLRAEVKYPLAGSFQRAEGGDVIKLCSNESPLGPSPKVVEVLKREAESVGRYPDSKAMELKEAIGDYLRIDPSRVCVGNGSDEIMDLICKAFMDPGDKVLIPIPTFSQYEIASRVNGGKPNFVELVNFEWCTEDLVDELNGGRLAFIARPNNPTGNSIDEDGLKGLLETGKLIVVDEAYAEFSGYSVLDWTDAYDNLIVLRTFSKSFGLAGLRVGFAVGSPRMVEVLERVRPPFSVNRLAQRAAVAALGDEDFLQRTINLVKEGRSYLQSELSDIGLRVLPSDANFLMASSCPLGTNAPQFCEYLAQRRILIRDLSGFRGAGSKWVRITVGTPEENRQFIDALKEFRRGKNDR